MAFVNLIEFAHYKQGDKQQGFLASLIEIFIYM